MFVKEIVINATSLSKISANTNSNSSTTNFTLTNIEGWNELPNIRRNTASILWEEGEIHSTDALYSERNVSITFYSEYPDNVNVDLLRENILVIANDVNNLYELHLNTYTDGVISRKEVLLARPAGNSFLQWQQTNNKVEITLDFVAPNPRKTVYLDGSVTAEVGGKL